MKKLIILSYLILSACASESAMPMGDNLLKIDVSAAPIYGRAGAQGIAAAKAAKATIENGYDKFKIVNADGWNEDTIQGGSYASFNANSSAAIAGNRNGVAGTANGTAYGSSGSFFQGLRNPESSMIIRMYHYKDKGSDSAIDAHKFLENYKGSLF